jgi:DNA-binding transcriptional ArsR family regulator
VLGAGPNLPTMSLAGEPASEAERERGRLRALAHPVRLRILSLLTSAPMTTAEAARELGLTHANVSYHLRQLLASGFVDVAGQERINGGVAKRYRYVFETERPRKAKPASRPTRDDRLVHAAMAAELTRRSALQRGRRNNHLTDAELWINPAEWEEIRAMVQAASKRLHRAAKPPRTPGTIRVNASMALFEMEPTG